MLVPAGEPDEGHWYQFDPLLFTGGEPLDSQGVPPRDIAWGENDQDSCVA
jgi:hypothetical protein